MGNQAIKQSRWQLVWSFVLEGLGLVGAFFVGRHVYWAWLILATNSILWIWYGISSHQYGFSISSTAFCAIYLRNSRRWWMETRYAEPAETGEPASTNLALDAAKLTSLEP